MNTFPQVIASWQTFYVLAGTAAVTLIGLLFVAMSINIELFRSRASADLVHFAALTFNCYFYVLLIAILFLVPGISAWGLAIPVFLLGILGTVSNLIYRSRSKASRPRGSQMDIASRFNIPILSLISMVLISVGIFLQIEASLYGFIVVIILLLGSASQNAWALLVEVRSAK